MLVAISVILVFFAATLAVGRMGSKRSGKASVDESFFLGGRREGALRLLLTLAATNFSAFTVLGFAGAGFKLGYVFYPVMGLGTAFMAVGMYLVGLPMTEAGSARAWVTPADFVADRYRSPVLTGAYAVSLVVFTMPYLALQPMAAGMLLETVFGVPYVFGALSVSVVIALYTIAGGFRAVVNTDVFHGFLFLALAAAAWWLVAEKLGGFAAAHAQVAARAPALLSRPGGAAGIPPAAFLGYFLLWFLADPMFPQLNQRFLAARDAKALERTIIAYPLITTVLFFLTVSTGVLGRAVMPDLDPASSDRIWPLLAASHGSGLWRTVLASVLSLAPLAALMTTMDSQLLTLSSIVIRDIAGKREAGLGAKRWAVAALAAVGAVVALWPPDEILDFLNRSSFLGYAAMSPLVLGGLYATKPDWKAGLASLAAGEAAVALLGFRLMAIPAVPDIFVVAAVSWGVFAIVPIFARPKASADGAFRPYRLGEALPVRWAALFLLILLPAFDFFNWGKTLTTVGGLPVWVAVSAGLGVVLSVALAAFFRSRNRNPPVFKGCNSDRSGG